MREGRREWDAQLPLMMHLPCEQVKAATCTASVQVEAQSAAVKQCEGHEGHCEEGYSQPLPTLWSQSEWPLTQPEVKLMAQAP